MTEVEKIFLENYKDAAEFEARVAQKLLYLDDTDTVCVDGGRRGIYCPVLATYKENFSCIPWCLLRLARLEVEEEMEKTK